jgi:cell division protein FtsW (lipid II flippase)
MSTRTLGRTSRPAGPRRVILGRSAHPINVGWAAVAAAAALSMLGVVAIGTVERPGEADYALRHLIFLVVGIAGAAVAAAPHYRWAQRVSYLVMAAMLLLLVFVLVPWVPESIVSPRNGARRWINLGILDFQPSELAKIAFVVALASYLRFRSNYRRWAGLLPPFILALLPMGLILREPDLGTSLLFLPTLLCMLVAAGARMRHLLLIVALGAAAAPAMYPLLEPHQKDRLKAMFAQVTGDTRYDDSIGFQQTRAKTLCGAGGVVGTGRSRAAALISHNRLPEDHNDMVFAVISCRWGLLGGLAVWGFFCALCASALLVAAQCKDPFGRLVPVGISAMLFSQMAINTGMTIGVLPITGMTLPFVSYGGSSLLSAWIMVGLLLNIAMRRARYLAPREAFEFDDDLE